MIFLFNSEDDYLKCPVCDYDYTHLEKLITFEDDDYNHLVSYSLCDGKKNRINRKINYPYRSQGNVQLLFWCEDHHYFYKGFDGHKGNVSVDQNPIMVQLCNFLNKIPNNVPTTEFNLVDQINYFFINILV